MRVITNKIIRDRVWEIERPDWWPTEDESGLNR
jgi:hypothetical protein